MANADVALTLSWPGSEVTISGFYSVADPYAVKLVMHADGWPTRAWSVSRDTLKDGLLFTTASTPEVRFYAGPEDSENVFLVFRGMVADGSFQEKRFLVQRKMLAWLIHRSELLVPLGTEDMGAQIDAFIANTLGASQ